MKKIILLVFLFLTTSCEKNSTSPGESSCGCQGSSDNTSWTFVANEGPYSGESYVSMIDDRGNVFQSETLGKIVHAVEVYNDKLIVSVNGSEKVVTFDINEQGLTNPFEIDFSGTPPREIEVVGNKAYISCFGDSDYTVYQIEPGFIKVLDLETLAIESTIEVGIMPEGMLYDSGYLWVANSQESTLSKIDITSSIVSETIDVGKGPQNLTIHNNEVYVSRRWYEVYEVDDAGLWLDYEELHGSSMIAGSEIVKRDYSSGVVCGGSVLSFNDTVYRSYSGGISPLDSELNLETVGRIGNYDIDVYHVEVVDGFLWLGFSGGSDSSYNELNGSVKVIDPSGSERFSFDVGINPGDFAHWSK